MRKLRALVLVCVFLMAVGEVGALTPATLTPETVGTIAFFPNLDLLHLASGEIQSTCFNTTGENLEFRRGFVEFGLPHFPRGILEATLILTETRGGWTSIPLPTDVHEVSSYAADLVVDTADYDAPATLVGTLETDPNDPPELREIRFNVTEVVRRAHGNRLGFRIKLQNDPSAPCTSFAGSDFGGLYHYPPRLEISARDLPGPGN